MNEILILREAQSPAKGRDSVGTQKDRNKKCAIISIIRLMLKNTCPALIFFPNIYSKMSLMKNTLSILFLLAIGFAAPAQTYLQLEPALTNSPGTISSKANVCLELGRQWEVFSLGADIGKTTFEKTVGRDTSLYLEIRPNLNIFQEGKFTNTLTPGIGFIFNAKENFMTELTNGIEYSYSPLIHINVFFGQYFYSGLYSASNTTFYGISVMKYFKPSKTKGLIKIKDKG